MKYIAPILDRTLDDVSNRTSKAYFNVSDWIRIYNNARVVQIMVSTLFGIQIRFDEVAPPTITTILKVSDLNTLLANIERTRIAASLPPLGLNPVRYDWQAGAASSAPDYQVVNDWERTLDTILRATPSANEYRVYCGVPSAGQERHFQYRYRSVLWVQPAANPVRRPRTNVATIGANPSQQNGFRRYRLVYSGVLSARRPRLKAFVCGSSLTRQNLFRRY